MVLCQYYMQGRCKFGDSCRYEHPSQNVGPPPAYIRSDNKFYDEVIADVLTAERGRQWPLSCFAPTRDHPMVPNMEDTSPEELRFLYYSCRKENRIQDYMNQWTLLLKQIESVRNFLKTPSAELATLLSEIMTKKSPLAASSTSTSIFGAAATQPTAPTNLFGSPTQSQSVNSTNLFSEAAKPSIFNGYSAASNTTFPPTAVAPTQQSSSIFGAPAQQQTNIFGAPQQPQQSGSIFGGGTSQPSQSIFSQPPTSNLFASAAPSSNVFSQAQVSQPNIFTSAPPPSYSSHTQSIFAPTSAQPSQSNIFQTSPPSSNIFQQANAQPSNVFQPTPISSQQQPNLFQSAGNPNQSVFPNAVASTNIFQSQPPQIATQPSATAQPTGNIFAGGPSAVVQNNLSVYSKDEELSENDKQAFASQQFQFGKIPLKPPSEVYCQ